MSAATTVLTARETIFHFFRGLPIMALSNLMLLGSFEGNFNYIFFAIGLGLFAPLVAVLTNMGFEYVISTIKSNSNYIVPIFLLLLAVSIFLIVAGTTDLETRNRITNNYYYILPGSFLLILTLAAGFCFTDDSAWLIPNGSSCTLFESISETPFNPMNGVPTVWTVMTSFFFSYLIFNAYDIYNRPVPEIADPISVNARKTRCMMSIVILFIVFVFILCGRAVVTHCETIIGIILGILLGGSSGYLWYNFLRRCGMGQFDDIFGISSRLLSREAAGNSAPKICVPTPS